MALALRARFARPNRCHYRVLVGRLRRTSWRYRGLIDAEGQQITE
jgi:hypothetical protein